MPSPIIKRAIGGLLVGATAAVIRRQLSRGTRRTAPRPSRTRAYRRPAENKVLTVGDVLAIGIKLLPTTAYSGVHDLIYRYVGPRYPQAAARLSTALRPIASGKPSAAYRRYIRRTAS
jgi:hypothetical protein